MAMIVRRAAKKAIFNAKDGHGLLGLLIFDEKLVFENFRKLVESKENGSYITVTEQATVTNYLLSLFCNQDIIHVITKLK